MNHYSLMAQKVKTLPTMQETQVQSLHWDWEIPWLEEPGGLQSMGLQRVGHDWGTNKYVFSNKFWNVSSLTLVYKLLNFIILSHKTAYQLCWLKIIQCDWNLYRESWNIHLINSCLFSCSQSQRSLNS